MLGFLRMWGIARIRGQMKAHIFIQNMKPNRGEGEGDFIAGSLPGRAPSGRILLCGTSARLCGAIFGFVCTRGLDLLKHAPKQTKTPNEDISPIRCEPASLTNKTIPACLCLWATQHKHLFFIVYQCG